MPIAEKCTSIRISINRRRLDIILTIKTFKEYQPPNISLYSAKRHGGKDLSLHPTLRRRDTG